MSTLGVARRWFVLHTPTMDRSSAVKVGVVILPEHRWAVAAEQWRCSESLGFDHAWTYDHLSWRDLRDSPWFGAVPTLAAAALVTTSIRLGVLVASPNYRHPVPFAKEIMSLDDLAGGRLTLASALGASDTTRRSSGRHHGRAESAPSGSSSSSTSSTCCCASPTSP
jgi:alkanesulfonate monooxygenase SsuD/methylene tetrahydromethanopterin reductase-like flavin-dependent oxidoreductase (luciferase family)